MLDLADFDDPADMTRAELELEVKEWRAQTWRDCEPPCDHDELVGSVSAGDLETGERFHAVATCAGCRVRSEGYVQMMTGRPVNPFVPFRGKAC